MYLPGQFVYTHDGQGEILHNRRIMRGGKSVVEHWVRGQHFSGYYTEDQFLTEDEVDEIFTQSALEGEV